MLEKVLTPEMMSEIDKQLERYYELPERDRFALKLLSLVCGLALCYLLLWQPLVNWSNKVEQDYQNKRELVNWIEGNKPALVAANAGGSGAQSRNGKTLLSIVNDESRRLKIKIKRVQPKGDDQLRVWLEGQTFDKVLSWMNKLETSYGISLISVNLERHKEAGLINATLMFSG